MSEHAGNLGRPDPSFNANPITFSYFPSGLRQTMADPSGTTTYTYDNRNRLTSKVTPFGTLSYTFDAAGNLLTLKSSNSGGASDTYTYDQLNRSSTVTDASGHGPCRPVQLSQKNHAFPATACGCPTNSGAIMVRDISTSSPPAVIVGCRYWESRSIAICCWKFSKACAAGITSWSWAM